MSGSELVRGLTGRSGSAARDPRLALVAAAAWLASATVAALRPPQPGLVIFSAVLLLGAVIAALWQPRPAGPVLILLGLALGSAIAAGHLWRSDPPALRSAVSDEAVASFVARIDSDPRSLPSQGRWQGPQSWLVTATVLEVRVRGGTLRGHLPMVLIGPPVGEAAYGAEVAAWGRLAPARAGSPQSAVLLVRGRLAQVEAPGVLARVSSRLRAGMRDVVAGLPRDSAALLLGLSDGDESLVSPALEDAMVAAGLSHLTAVSGSNTSMVMGLGLAAAITLGLRRRWRVAIPACLLGCYVVLVHPQPSVLRAAAMGLVGLLAMSRGATADPLAALSLATIGLLATFPGYSLSLGFALSVLATAGLILLAGPIERRLRRSRIGTWLPPPVVRATAVTLAAILATLPLSVAMGNGISLVAVPANLVVAPLVPVVTVLGLCVCVLALPVPGLAHWLAGLVAPLPGAIAQVAYAAAGLALGRIGFPDGWAGALAVLGLALAGLAAHRWLPGGFRWRATVGIVAVVLVSLVVRSRWQSAWPPPDWRVVACDVGQGDAIVLRDPTPGPTSAVVVDTGPDPAALRRCLTRLGVQKVGAVLITHLHADHVGGIHAVRDLWPARWHSTPILVSRLTAADPGANEVLGLAPDQPEVLLQSGGQVRVGGLSFAVLWPGRPIEESPLNNTSLVILASMPAPGRALRVLLTADVENEAQAAMMARWPTQRPDIVKLAHHGSARLVPGFVDWSAGRVALASAGRDNDYGHPSPTTLAAYSAAGSLVGRTDLQGGLAVADSGGVLRLVTQR